jgi:tetratricopeptide (TPR) repeat protein
MTNDREIPKGSIAVVPFFKNEWRFQFPRLDERVTDMFYDALDDLDAGALGQAETNLRLLLDGYPEFIDAHHHLAVILDERRRHKEARQRWEVALRIGRNAFPKTFKRGRHRLPWGILDNRPFLRVCQSWAIKMLEEEKIPDALTMCEEMLSMNPNDNQGMRAIAIDCYFRLRQPTKVLALCKRYPDDAMEEVLYGLPLALYQLGREEEARSALTIAVELLPNVSKELLKKTHHPPKKLNPEFVTQGGEDQGYYYWKYNGGHWAHINGALELLASIARKR